MIDDKIRAWKITHPHKNKKYEPMYWNEQEYEELKQFMTEQGWGDEIKENGLTFMGIKHLKYGNTT